MYKSRGAGYTARASRFLFLARDFSFDSRLAMLLQAREQEPEFLPHGQQPPIGSDEGAAPVLALAPLAAKLEICRLNLRPLPSGSATGLSASAMGRTNSITAPSCSLMYS